MSPEAARVSVSSLGAALGRGGVVGLQRGQAAK